MLTSLEHSPREGVIAMKRVVALILAGGQGGRLSILSQERAKPAVPFAGKYRIIDFTLSNCVNSGIFKVGVLTQYRPRSLNEHIGIGKPWDLDRQGGGVRLLQPFLGPQGSDWYKGTADAVYQNIYYAEDQKAELVLVLSGVQLICIGLMGQYVSRIFEETKKRPLYFLKSPARSSSNAGDRGSGGQRDRQDAPAR